MFTYILVFVLHAVCGDVSSLDSVRRANGAAGSASSSGDNSNSFSILTKEFLSKPDPDDPRATKNFKPNSNRNLAPLPVIRVNGINNNLAETDDSDERQAYYYDKPKIPFETEDRESTNIVSSTIPPKR